MPQDKVQRWPQYGLQHKANCRTVATAPSIKTTTQRYKQLLTRVTTKIENAVIYNLFCDDVGDSNSTERVAV
jgi:hypothetical protein